MRILHTIPGRNWGGMEHRIVEQMRWLNEHGHDAWLATPADGEAFRRGQAMGLPLVAFEFDRPWRPSTLEAMRRLVRGCRIEVVDAHVSRDAKVAIGCLDLCAVVRSRHVTHPLTTSLERRLQWRSGADWVVAAADCIRNHLIEAGLADPERSTTIGEWAEDRFFLDARQAESARMRLRAEFDVDAAARLLVCVGMLRPDKGQDVLIRAVSALKAQGTLVRCLLVGGATAEGAAWDADLRDVAAAGDVAELVRFAGYRDDVPELMAAGDVVVVPSLTEGQSRVAVQALAAGRPVVASRVGGVPEVVEDGVTGWLVPPKNPDALAVAIAAALAEPAVAETRAAEGHRRVATAMRLDHQMERTLEVYRAAIAHARRFRRVGGASTSRTASRSAATAVMGAWHALANSVYTGVAAPRYGDTRWLLKIAATALVMGPAIYLLSQTSNAIEIFAISAGSEGLVELGDETQILVLALTAHFGRIAPVIWGTLIATLANDTIAAFVGEEVMALIGGDPSRWLLLVLLVALGVWMLIPDKGDLLKADGSSSVFLTTLVLMFLAEIGDKTEIATILLAAKYQTVVPVVLGTMVGTLVTDGLTAVFGNALAKRLPLRLTRRSSAAMFLVLGVAMLPL